MSNKKLTSHIFSLGQPFEYKPCELNTFIELGEASLGIYHIAIFCRNVVSSVLHVDVGSIVELNPFCSAYSITNKRGSVYGTLFCVDISKVVLEPQKLIVNGIEPQSNDFNIYPYANERSNLLFYKDSADTVLVITSAPENNPFIVLDDKHG